MEGNKVLAIILRYEEKNWHQGTRDCVERANPECIIEADREGVGSISRAFNNSVSGLGDRIFNYDYVWFVTNVIFPPEMLGALVAAFDHNTAGVHPKFQSDHHHIAKAPVGGSLVNFIEWTSPMLSVRAIADVGLLDQKLPYWGMDLDWSYRARMRGWNLKAEGTYHLEHTYLRHNAPEPISRLREQLRKLRDASTIEQLTNKYGPKWREIIWT